MLNPIQQHHQQQQQQRRRRRHSFNGHFPGQPG